ncbi:MAG: hypothetical protein V3V95_02520 [Thermodesulfobacteriota bacterium]
MYRKRVLFNEEDDVVSRLQNLLDLYVEFLAVRAVRVVEDYNFIWGLMVAQNDGVFQWNGVSIYLPQLLGRTDTFNLSKAPLYEVLFGEVDIDGYGLAVCVKGYLPESLYLAYADIFYCCLELLRLKEN